MRVRTIVPAVIIAACVATAASAQRIDMTQSVAQNRTAAPSVQVPVPPPPMVHTTALPPSAVPPAVSPPTGPGPNTTASSLPPAPPAPVANRGWQQGQSWHGGSRWGQRVDGRWWAGAKAPGGWHAYRRLGRGTALPRYWFSPSFFITDYAYYGLGAPPYGYRWVRYYDDAVLVNDRGDVWDTIDGIDWSRGDYFAGDGRGAPPYYGPPAYGAPGAGYPPPVAMGPPPPPSAAPIIQPDPSGQGYTRTYVAGGYYAAGYWFPPTVTTVVTVQSQPVVTTTTTEYVETRYRSVARRKVHRPVKRRVAPRPACHCGCCR